MYRLLKLALTWTPEEGLRLHPFQAAIGGGLGYMIGRAFAPPLIPEIYRLTPYTVSTLGFKLPKGMSPARFFGARYIEVMRPWHVEAAERAARYARTGALIGAFALPFMLYYFRRKRD
ncbi:MAG: hypothetical protein QXG39_02860 [Candidatus Aenigmatarchaeota archaeon]